MGPSRGRASILISPTRLLLQLAALGCLALSAAMTPMHWIDVSTPRLVELAAFTPWGTPFALVALIASLGFLPMRGTRRKFGAFAAVSGAILAVHLWWLTPLYYGQRPATAGQPLLVLSQNFEYGDPALLAQVVRDEHVDVLVLTDVDNHRVKEISATDIPQLLPHSTGAEPNENLTSVIFSRFPIKRARSGPHSSHADLLQLRTPSLGDVNLVAVHPQPPYTRRWRPDYRALTSFLRSAVPQPGMRPTIVAGDFNATTDNLPFRGLLNQGFADALTQTRGGFQPTWPDSSTHRYLGVPVPRLVTIDHILLSRQLAASQFELVHVPGADNSGVLVSVKRRAH